MGVLLAPSSTHQLCCTGHLHPPSAITASVEQPLPREHVQNRVESSLAILSVLNKIDILNLDFAQSLLLTSLIVHHIVQIARPYQLVVGDADATHCERHY